MAPTMKDVAQLAQVSVATVSRVLAGHVHVDPATRQRVLEAAEALHYQPDQVARSLRLRRTNLIGLVVSTIENVFFTEMAHAAEQAALQRGYSLIVCNTDENPEQEKAYLNVLDGLLVAGVVLAPAPGHAEHLRRYIKDGPPVVLVNRRLDDVPCCRIISDDEDAAYHCVSSLIRDGRRRIAAITGLPGTSTTADRLRGYRRALAEAGLPAGPDLGLEVSGQSHLEGGYRAARELMQRSDPPDALFAFNNLMTQGAVMALQDLGLWWPDPVDVAGFGAFTEARLYQPPLTLIAQPTHEMGERAIEILIGQVEGRLPQTMETVVLRNRLLLRASWSRAWNERRIGE